jgi:hypothetical protein
MGIGGDIDVLLDIAGMAVRDLDAIDPDGGQCRDAAQLQLQIAAMPCLGQAEGAAIPADAPAAEGKGVVLVGLDGMGDGKVMRDADRCPSRVVIGIARRALRIAGFRGGIGFVIAAHGGKGQVALVEQPAFIKAVERGIGSGGRGGRRPRGMGMSGKAVSADLPRKPPNGRPMRPRPVWWMTGTLCDRS